MRPPFKLCPRCGLVRGRSEFSVARARRDGLQRVCKHCNASHYADHRDDRIAYNHDRYWANRSDIRERERRRRVEHGDEMRARERANAAKNREAVRARQKAYNDAHRDEIRAWDRAYRAAHKDEWRAWYEGYRERRADHISRYMVEWRKRNRDHLREYQRAWTAEHREEVCAQQNNRRAQKLAGGTHTASDVVAQHERQKYRCYWCGTSTKKTYHVDHVTPLSRGGTNGPENIVIACPSCNLHKHAKHPMDFAGVLC